MRATTLTEWISWPTAAEPWFRARTFGALAQDLSVDFHGQSRPLLLTQLLHLCLSRADEVEFTEHELWSWTLPRRSQALLAVASASGVTRVDALAHCEVPQCREAMELPLPLTSFASSDDTTVFDWTSTDGHTFNVALPTGADQLHWLDAPPASFNAMAQRLAHADAPLSTAALDDLSTALEQKDPFTALRINASCPACAADVTMNLDLEAQLLHRLERIQEYRLREVHLLASRYHWSEIDIMNLPAWRRANYLRQVIAERPS